MSELVNYTNTSFTTNFIEKKLKIITVNIADGHSKVTGERVNKNGKILIRSTLYSLGRNCPYIIFCCKLTLKAKCTVLFILFGCLSN